MLLICHKHLSRFNNIFHCDCLSGDKENGCLVEDIKQFNNAFPNIYKFLYHGLKCLTPYADIIENTLADCLKTLNFVVSSQLDTEFHKFVLMKSQSH